MYPELFEESNGMFSFLNYRAENNLEIIWRFSVTCTLEMMSANVKVVKIFFFRAKCILFKSKYKKVGVLPIVESKV